MKTIIALLGIVFIMSCDVTNVTEKKRDVESILSDPYEETFDYVSYVFNKDGNTSVVLHNRANYSDVTVANNIDAEWTNISPKGDYLIFAAAIGDQKSIYSYNIGTEALIKFSEIKLYSETYPRVSPDAKYILFHGKESADANENIYQVNLDGTGFTQLTNDPASDRFANWSLDGKDIYFISDRNNDSNRVYKMNIASKAITKLDLPDSLSFYEMAVSHSGQKIAFSAKREGGLRYIYLYDIILENLEYIYPFNAPGTGSYDATQFSWSPDDSMIILNTYATTFTAFVNFKYHLDNRVLDELLTNITSGSDSYASWVSNK